MGNTTLGVIIMLVATSLMNMGAVVQKKAVDRLPRFEGRSLGANIRAVIRTPLWCLGWLLTTVAVVLNMVALGMADISVVQPLNGFGLVVLVLFSRFYLGERMDSKSVLGISLIVAGVAFVGFFLPESRVFGDSAELVGSYLQPAALGLLLLLGLGVLGGQQAARIWPRAAGILLALAAAVASVLSFTFSKGLFGVLGMLSLSQALVAPSTWALLALVLFFSFVALALQTLSFQKGLAIVVTPVFGASSVVLPLLTGRLVFGERLPALVLLAPLLITAGVVILGLRTGETAVSKDNES